MGGPGSRFLSIVLLLAATGWPAGAQTQFPPEPIKPTSLEHKKLDDLMRTRRSGESAPASSPSGARAQQLIDACWEENQDRFALTKIVPLLEAYGDILGCLEETIGNRYPSLLKRGKFSDGKMISLFEQLRTPFQSLHYFLLTENTACNPECDPRNSILFLIPYARFLEDTIRDMEYMRDAYKLNAMPVPKK